MKICKIYIKNFEQFQDIELDFTNPETGEPLDKICFIGSNGTGKSKLLNLINRLFTEILKSLTQSAWGSSKLIPKEAKVIFKLLHKNSNFLIFQFGTSNFTLKIEGVNQESEKILVQDLFSLESTSDFTSNQKYRQFTTSTLNSEFLDELLLKDNKKDILIYSPAETEGIYNIGKEGVPDSNVNEALGLMKNFPFYSEVSPKKVNNLWKLLLYNLRKRAEERDGYENLPENLIKTKDVLIKEFDSKNPKILEYLSKVWNKILNKAGLEFDFEGASNPYQLTDNLRVYIRLVKSKQIIPYNELSTGIKNFIFRIGHIYSLYFNREIDRGFLLVDEPENSLFPDFLFDLVETYNEVLIDKRGQNNTQMFFASHNPIVAAQFKSFERVILVWNEDGTVKAVQGSAPEGDDPNDLLKKDFGIRELMGQKGIEVWNHYLNLKRKLKKAEATEEKMELAAEINKIGQLYNFPA